MNPEHEHLKHEGEASDKQSCKNCSTDFQGNFCPACGQSIKNFDRPLRFIMVDFAGNLFAFDTRVWRTLSNVLLKPGKMEQEYVDGKRRKYMPPFRLYVFVSFIFFLLLTYVSNKSIRENKEIFSAIQLNKIVSDTIDYELKLNQLLQNKLPEQERNELLAHLNSLDSARVEQSKPMDIQIKMGKNDLDVQSIIDNPEIFITRFFKFFSWALFLLMPVYGLLLWLFFHHQRKYYFPHFVLSISQHVFIFIIFTLLMIVQLLLPGKSIEPENYLAALIPIYAIVGSHRLYGSGWLVTVLRMIPVFFIYLFVVAIASGAVLYFTFT